MIYISKSSIFYFPFGEKGDMHLANLPDLPDLPLVLYSPVTYKVGKMADAAKKY